MTSEVAEAFVSQLLSADPDERMEAIRELGSARQQRELLEVVAMRDEVTEETLSACFWLALAAARDDERWLKSLGRSALALRNNHTLQNTAFELHLIAAQAHGLLEEE